MKKLCRKLGYSSQTLSNESETIVRAAIIEEFSALREQARLAHAPGSLILYFSTHGTKNDEDEILLCCSPVNAFLNLKTLLVELCNAEWPLGKTKRRDDPIIDVVMVLDACETGTPELLESPWEELMMQLGGSGEGYLRFISILAPVVGRKAAYDGEADQGSEFNRAFLFVGCWPAERNTSTRRIKAPFFPETRLATMLR